MGAWEPRTSSTNTRSNEVSTIVQEYGYPRDTAYEEIKAYVENVKQAGIRHIVNTSPTPDTVTMFRALNELGMNEPGYSLLCRRDDFSGRGA